ncbi:MAG: 23S rRNA (guanosine(2251)-2'-O)-methyltransferase RlmB [Flavobacteriaceae bacterium]|nr:23S rRNA (guanosine(2251)-2'-O)-methyltransferase RlmB [Flavobacteriaceae bacterium]MBT4958871.1 23S rRNA (guanosine(2251)-2'-O)-methyltransferase RlmB [Flavobacteriaceae bacterium]MBT6448925.1 23S rRNA (guanosine(2251)-2'-O)-methyltransferase RlmB [Flavobacteriaceae bacterium]MDG1831537.1 23S rRNA (guanosine(2251)-2'-O)-methyltransferase RlmB [Flavobacteriaceae bacterium]|tara:strand:- start:66 stop:806 length:741 start_codon:yes stop_codon:yes gene_type:complete
MSKEHTLIYGIRSVKEAIESEKSLNRVYIQRGLKGASAFDLIKTLNKKDIEISYVPIEKLNRFTLKNHQGVVATISPIKFLSINDLSKIVEKKKDSCQILILDQISDVRNFGAIVRTAECSGVDCIIIQSSGSAPVNGDTIKTSSGAVFNVPICKVSHIKDAIFLLKQLNIKIYGATEKAEKNIYQTDFKSSQAIIMGSEGKGLSRSVVDLCDELIKIPLLGKIESLNVSVACGTILYEIVRQKAY